MVEELAASGEVGFFIFASQLGVVRRERLKLAADGMLAELLTQLIDESLIRMVRAKALAGVAAWRQAVLYPPCWRTVRIRDSTILTVHILCFGRMR